MQRAVNIHIPERASLSNVEIPDGLVDLLQQFTIAVLRERPLNLVQFASSYFNKLQRDSRSGGLKEEEEGEEEQEGATSMNEDDSANAMQTRSEDDEEADDIISPTFASLAGRRKSVAAESYDPEADVDDSELERTIKPKSDEERRTVTRLVCNILLFRTLEKDSLNDVIDAMEIRLVKAGDKIIVEGDDGDYFYAIQSGLFDVFKNDSVSGQPVKRHTYDGNGFFGELALLYNQPRQATIIAQSDGVIWALDRKTFHHTVVRKVALKRKMYQAFLENCVILSHMNAYERMNVADALRSIEFSDGQLIIEQGAPASCMYFVERGNVRVTVRESHDAPEVQVTTLNEGGYFGELALITHQPRAASVYAVGSVRVAMLEVEAFERLLGPCLGIMQRNAKDYETQLKKLGLANRLELRHANDQRHANEL